MSNAVLIRNGHGLSYLYTWSGMNTVQSINAVMGFHYGIMTMNTEN